MSDRVKFDTFTKDKEGKGAAKVLKLSTEMRFKPRLRQKNHVCLFLDVVFMCELDEQVLSVGATVPQSVL